MLNYSVTQEADALEKHFCEPLEELGHRELSLEETGILMKLLKIPEKDFASNEEVKNNQYMKVLNARASGCCTAKFDTRSLYMIMCISEAIGHQIIYLYQSQYLAKKNNIKNVTFEDFCGKLFPHGFYDDANMSKVWKSCKITERPSGASDNLIDYGKATYSIQFDDIMKDIIAKNKEHEEQKQKVRKEQAEEKSVRTDKISVNSPPKHSCFVEAFYKSSPSIIHRLFYDASRGKFVTLKKFRNRTHKLIGYIEIKTR